MLGSVEPKEFVRVERVYEMQLSNIVQQDKQRKLRLLYCKLQS